MAIGAMCAMDQRLTMIYADKQTVNLEGKSSMDPEVFWQNMTMVAVNNKAFISLKKA